MAVPEIILRGVGGNFFLTSPCPGHAERHKRPPQDKSEYQLLPPHLNILVPLDKLDVIMHPPSGQKTVATSPPKIISGTALNEINYFACFDSRIFWYNSCSTARCIKQYAVETLNNLQQHKIWIIYCYINSKLYKCYEAEQTSPHGPLQVILWHDPKSFWRFSDGGCNHFL